MPFQSFQGGLYEIDTTSGLCVLVLTLLSVGLVVHLTLIYSILISKRIQVPSIAKLGVYAISGHALSNYAINGTLQLLDTTDTGPVHPIWLWLAYTQGLHCLLLSTLFELELFKLFCVLSTKITPTLITSVQISTTAIYLICLFGHYSIPVVKNSPSTAFVYQWDIWGMFFAGGMSAFIGILGNLYVLCLIETFRSSKDKINALKLLRGEHIVPLPNDSRPKVRRYIYMYIASEMLVVLIYLSSNIFHYAMNDGLVLRYQLDCIVAFLVSMQVVWACVIFDTFKAAALPKRSNKLARHPKVVLARKRPERDPESNVLLTAHQAPPPSAQTS